MLRTQDREVQAISDGVACGSGVRGAIQLVVELARRILGGRASRQRPVGFVGRKAGQAVGIVAGAVEPNIKPCALAYA